MNFLNAQQLAFILEIKKEDARARMCRAWQKSKGIELETTGKQLGKMKDVKRGKSKKIEDDYPQAMPIDLLAEGLNIPSLQKMVNDIELNYLNRPASKKWILVDYPEKFIKKCEESGKQFPVSIDIPPALKSILPAHTKEKIYSYWEGFKTNDLKPRFIIPSNG